MIDSELTPIGGGGFTTGIINPPQLFNPDATALTNDTDVYSVESTFGVAFVTINGQVLDDSEYSLVGSNLTVTPDNGFNNLTDEVLVFQHSNSTPIGGVVLPFSQKSSTYIIDSSDHVIECTANTFTVTLPSAAVASGQNFVIKNSGVGVITVDGDGTETIDGDLTQTLLQYESITLSSNGINWIII
jgi:hypothetical protein